MKFGIFIEQNLPRPWSPGDEHRLAKQALEQVELADRLDFDAAWIVEHHFLEEYSHASAPEVFLAAASQRTRRIRLGHGIMQLPPRINHPFRVAERIATLDQVMFLCQGGRIRHGDICASLELFAAQVMPEFHEREAERERAKAERLAPAIEAALARRDPPRPPPDSRFGAGRARPVRT